MKGNENVNYSIAVSHLDRSHSGNAAISAIYQMRLTDNMRRRMTPEARKALGKEGLTTEEAIAKRDARDELADHHQFQNFCLLKGIYFEITRHDKRSTRRVGALDFALAYRGRALFLEFKRPGRKPTKEQDEVLRFHAGAGNPAYVVYSLSEAIELCYKHLPLKAPND
jgi:hypothetical protein